MEVRRNWGLGQPCSSSRAISLSGSDYVFPVAIFAGNKLARLEKVASGTGSVTFGAVQGREYQIAVSDAAGLTGKILMTLAGPLIECPLLDSKATFRTAILSFKASPGQILLLQRSSDGLTWHPESTATAHGGSASFRLSRSDTSAQFHYRAVVVDLAGARYRH